MIRVLGVVGTNDAFRAPSPGRVRLGPARPADHFEHRGVHRSHGSGLLALLVVLLSGCASVPMASPDLDASAKTFKAPAGDRAGLYVYRDSFGGKALKKMVSIDGKAISQTANKVYFYREITPGAHTLSTESEFGDNTLDIQAAAGRNIFVRQSIKLGVFIGGSALELVAEEDGKKAILECERAEPSSVRGSRALPELAFAEGKPRCIGLSVQ